MRKNMVRIFALILVLAMAVGFLAMIPAQATDSNAVQIVFNNVEYGEKLSLMYAVYGEEVNYETDVAVTLYTDAACTQKWCDATYSYTATEGKVANCGIFIAEKGVPAQAIDTVLYAKATMGENSSLVQRYSVLEYLHKRLSVDAGTISAEQKTMYETLLNFAAAAQPVIYKTDPYTPINNYTYVHVDNGTYKGYATGMYLQGGTIALSDLAADGTVLSWNYQIVGGESGELTEALAIGTQTIILTAEIDETVEPSEPEETTPTEPAQITEEATITFDNTAKRTSFSTSQQVWEENAITVTNNKGSSTSNVADYANPVRFYKSSEVVIECADMSKIVFNCNTTTYASDLANGITGAEVDGKVVTIELTEITDSVTYTMPAQIRVDSIVITRVTCPHNNVVEIEDKAPTCTVNGYTDATECSNCGAILGTVVPATGHDYEEVVTAPNCTEKGYTTFSCTCGDTYTGNDVNALGHIDENGDNLCDREACGYEFPATGGETTTKTIEFALGANGSATHKDGSSNKTSYTETVDGYTLSLVSGANMYPSSIDAKGNGCIKLGTSSKTGSFTFTVPDDVTEVKIYIGKYKDNTTKITVNGTAYTLTQSSNSGAYDEIVIDTTSTKTITLTTVSGGVRAMVNTIVYVAVDEE